MTEVNSKLNQLAQMIDGKVVLNKVARPVCVNGILSGFPISLEAIQAGYPFGVSYFLETGQFSSKQNASFKLTILPKYAKGLFSHITRFLFFERSGQKLDLSTLDSAFAFKYDNGALVKQFIYHSGVAENILLLQKESHFSEMVIRSDAGLYLSQPTSFSELDLTLCQTIFSTMAKLAQVLFETF